MTMFKNKTRAEGQPPAQAGNTLIGNGTSISGDVQSSGDIRIDGNVIGNVRGSAKVVIGSTGTVVGDVHCMNADIQGKVNGRLNIGDMLFLRGDAVIDGDVYAGKLQIEPNVTFNGHCHMGKDEKVVEMTSDESHRAVGIR